MKSEDIYQIILRNNIAVIRDLVCGPEIGWVWSKDV